MLFCCLDNKKKKTVFAKVLRSDLWGSNLTFLKNFYLTHLFPKTSFGNFRGVVSFVHNDSSRNDGANFRD